MLDVEDLQVFAEVADAGGLTRAGRHLGMSKSVLSRRLSRLEDALGVALVSRSPRGVFLTEAGANFKPFAERMISEMEAAREAVSNSGEPSGRLRVAAPLSFGISHVAPLLADLALRHPRLRVQAFYSDRFVDLIGERFDAAIWIGGLADSSLLAKRIATIRASLVASPGYLAAHGAPRSLEDLAGHKALVHSDQAWRFRDGKRLVTIRPDAHFTADNSQALLAAAVAGLGVALLPSFLIGEGILAKRLVPLLPEHPCPEEGLFLLRPPSPGEAPTKVKALMHLLMDSFGRDVEWDACQRQLQQGKPPVLTA